MNITQIPFNHFLGIKESPGDGPYLLELDDLPVYRNHLHTVHASVQLALAEACSAEYLLRTFKDVDADVLVVVRRVQAKFKKLVKGRIFSKAHTLPGEIRRFSEILDSKGMAILAVAVEVVDGAGVLAMSAVVEWFIQKPKRT
jgi:hypothetical protein